MMHRSWDDIERWCVHHRCSRPQNENENEIVREQLLKQIDRKPSFGTNHHPHDQISEITFANDTEVTIAKDHGHIVVMMRKKRTKWIIDYGSNRKGCNIKAYSWDRLFNMSNLHHLLAIVLSKAINLCDPHVQQIFTIFVCIYTRCHSLPCSIQFNGFPMCID